MRYGAREETGKWGRIEGRKRGRVGGKGNFRVGRAWFNGGGTQQFCAERYILHNKIIRTSTLYLSTKKTPVMVSVSS